MSLQILLSFLHTAAAIGSFWYEMKALLNIFYWHAEHWSWDPGQTTLYCTCIWSFVTASVQECNSDYSSFIRFDSASTKNVLNCNYDAVRVWKAYINIVILYVVKQYLHKIIFCYKNFHCTE